MSKANREKRQQHVNGFPFKLLQGWIKPYVPEGEMCKCSRPVAYVLEHYIDAARMRSLMSEGMPEPKAIDIVWDHAVREQRRGKYRKYLSTYHCQECTHTILSGYVGDNGATLMLLPVMITGRSTVLIGTTLQSLHDDGKAFAACAVAHTIEDVARQLKGETRAINLK